MISQSLPRPAAGGGGGIFCISKYNFFLHFPFSWIIMLFVIYSRPPSDTGAAEKAVPSHAAWRLLPDCTRHGPQRRQIDMKKYWEQPRVMVQVFEPNEYVAVCWGVACATENAN